LVIKTNGGPFSLVELKVIQEIFVLGLFVIFSTIFFNTEALGWNHIVGFIFLIITAFFIFKKFDYKEKNNGENQI
jgi:uncharacterized protein (DUF486 family)